MSFVSYAQNFEDVLIHRVFGGQATGFYVDVGAYDPVVGSVTKATYDRGWSGINVEPGPIFDKLAAARPRDINLCMAVADQAGEVSFFDDPDDPGMSRIVGNTPPDATGIRTVRCDTLAGIVHDHAGGRPIDILKLDCEGAEARIIRATDWRILRPVLLIIEATLPWSSILANSEWEPALLEQGYRRAYFDGINCFYIPEEREELLRHFALPVNVLDVAERYDPRIAEAEAAAAAAQGRVEALTSQLAAELAQARAQHSDDLTRHEQLHAANREQLAVLAATLNDTSGQLAAVRQRLDALPAEQSAAIAAVAEAHAFQAAELRRQVAELDAQCAMLRLERDRERSALQMQLEAVSRERDALAPLRGEAARLRQLMRVLQWPDGPAALRAVLPIARLLRRLRGTPVPPVPPEEAALLAPHPDAPTAVVLVAAPSPMVPARRSLAKRAAFLAYRPFRPLGRPAALRLRAFLTLQLQTEFRQLEARLGQLGDELRLAVALPPVPLAAPAMADPRISDLQTDIRQFGKLLEATLLTLAMEAVEPPPALLAAAKPQPAN